MGKDKSRFPDSGLLKTLRSLAGSCGVHGGKRDCFVAFVKKTRFIGPEVDSGGNLDSLEIRWTPASLGKN